VGNLRHQRLLVSVLPRHESIPRYRAVATFSDLAEQQQRPVLAPHFDFTSGFQWLGIGGAIRYDLQLLRMVEHARQLYPAIEDRFDLFGYSAGGQFAHRFLYLHPDRLGSIAIGAPGTMTLASTEHQWPTGIANLAALAGTDIDLGQVRACRILLFVGDQDVTSENLSQTEEANRLGRTRVERARSLHQSWLNAGIVHRFTEVPGMGHADVDLAMEEVRQFLAGD
jgi:pimeloyl-ACP methyl ester carboxylesterase